MPKLTRRLFLHYTPVSAAALGLLPTLPALGAAPRPSPAPPGTDSMIVHINNVASGDMTLLVGGREIALRDRRMVARFIDAAR